MILLFYIDLSQRAVKGILRYGYSRSFGDTGFGFHSSLNQRQWNPISFFPPSHQHYSQLDPTVSPLRSPTQQGTETNKTTFSTSSAKRTAVTNVNEHQSWLKRETGHSWDQNREEDNSTCKNHSNIRCHPKEFPFLTTQPQSMHIHAMFLYPQLPSLTL